MSTSHPIPIVTSSEEYATLMEAYAALARELQEAHQQIQELELRQQVVRDASLDALISIDTQEKVLEWNPAAEQLFGYTREQVLGRSLAELIVPPVFREAHTRGIRHFLHTGEGPALNRRIQVPALNAAGEELPIELTAIPIRVGEEVFFTASIRDLSAQKRSQEALEQSYALLQAVIESAPIVLTAYDLHGMVTFSRGGDLTALGIAQDWSVGRSVYELSKEQPRFAEGVLRALNGENNTFEIVHAERTYHVDFRPQYKGAERVVIGALSFSHDITERCQREEALRTSEQRLHLALDQSAMGLWHVDLLAQKFLYISPRALQLFGQDEGANYTWSQCLGQIAPDDLPAVQEAIGASLRTGESVSVEFRIGLPEGTQRWIRAAGSAITDARGGRTQIIGVSQDITAQKIEEARRELALSEAQERAERDPLTNLLNHRAFHRRLEEEAIRAQREGTSLAVVMIDLDNFKFFNDVYGHAVGDEVLRLIALRLQNICRPYDILARFGGDEFALILPGVQVGSIAELEVRLRTDLADIVYQPEGYESAIPLTLSLGGALYPQTSENRRALIESADARLRRAKTGGEGDSAAEKTRDYMSRTLAGFSMLDALVTAVDNKDRYTRRHSEDVMAYCLQIARQLGLDDATQHTLAVAALLHDVGKIGVPDFILRKPGKLTEAELQAVKQHAAMGAAIVSAVPGLEDTLDCVRHHHERWDGKGYPAGLAGESVPYLARLMAVADAYSAMTTDRPYRQGMPAERACAILRAGAGSQWDARMVEAFLSVSIRTD